VEEVKVVVAKVVVKVVAMVVVMVAGKEVVQVEEKEAATVVVMAVVVMGVAREVEKDLIWFRTVNCKIAKFDDDLK